MMLGDEREPSLVSTSTKILLSWVNGTSIVGPALWLVRRRYSDGSEEVDYHEQTYKQAAEDGP